MLPLHRNEKYPDAIVWRLARVVEEARLESVYTGNRIEGSNPSVSALIMKISLSTSSNAWRIFHFMWVNVMPMSYVFLHINPGF